MRTPSEQMALHPTQTLDRLERNLAQLKTTTQEEELLKASPSLVHWS